MKKFIVVLIVLAVLGAITAGAVQWGIGKYNSLITQGQNVDKSWGQVENVLQRRNDLIPNLVNVVQAYAVHEQEVFIKVAEARASWNKTMQNGTIGDKIKADEAVRGALLNLMAMVERYPEIKANENFLALQDELAGTENRIAVERMRYNESVQGYNTYAMQFPTNLIVKAFNFPSEREYFKSVEGAEKAPEVKMTFPGVPVPGVPPPGQPIQAAPGAPQVLPATGITPPPVPTTGPATSPPPAGAVMPPPTPPTGAVVPPPPPPPSAATQPIPPPQVAPAQPMPKLPAVPNTQMKISEPPPPPTAVAPATPVSPTTQAPQELPVTPVSPPATQPNVK